MHDNCSDGWRLLRLRNQSIIFLVKTVAGTRLFRGGTKSDIETSEIEKALETLCISIGVQRSAADTPQQNRRTVVNV